MDYQLLAAVRGRLATYMETHDPAVVRDPQAADEANRLFNTLEETDDAFDVLYSVAWLYWWRFSARPGEGDHLDLAIALRLFGLLQSVDPDLLPPKVLTMVSARKQRDALHAQAFELLNNEQRTGDDAAVSSAIEAFRRAVQATPPEDPDRIRSLSNLGMALRIHYEHDGNPTHLDEAIEIGRQAVEIGEPYHQELGDLGVAWSELCVALRMRSEHSGDMADLDAAVEAGYRSVQAVEPGEPALPGIRSNLAIALRLRFERTGSSEYLDAAVEILRMVLTEAHADDPNWPRFLANLGNALRTRFQHTEALTDLDEAIDLARAAADAFPRGHPDHRMALSNVAMMLMLHFDRAEDPADLDDAVELSRQAAATVPATHPARMVLLSRLGSALLRRFEWTGSVEDLNEAITVFRVAVRDTPAGHPYLAPSLDGLGQALWRRAEGTGSAEDLNEAVEMGRRAAKSAAGQPHRAVLLLNLGRALMTRFERTGDHGAADEGIAGLREAALTDGAALDTRSRAAARWGRLAGSAGRAAAALEGFATAVELLPPLAWHGLRRADQEHLLGTRPWLASEAAAWALQCGQPQRAVELLELGRGVMLTQALEGRAEFTELIERAPDLARRLSEVRRALDQTVDDPGEPRDRPALARAWDELIEQARTIPGLEAFLRPPRFDDLAEAAADGPVVIVNVAECRCDAIIVTRQEPQVVSLPALSAQTLHENVVTLAAAVDEQNPRVERIVARSHVPEMLTWLQEAVTGPVLAALDFPAALKRRPPRVWWCPTGLLSFLPLHAADGVIDAVVSSYTPTLRMLLHARTRGPVPTSRLLLVATPRADLPNVDAEIRYVMQRAGNITPLIGTDATRQRVLEELERHPWVHFACHGSQNVGDPSSGHLLLRDDEPLSVLDIARRHPGHAELAVLSACETAMGGGLLSDEAVTLATALQLAGYRHVVATLWSIQDNIAPDMAEGLYRRIWGGGDTAYAVHEVVRELRNRYPAHPLRWAPFIHSGP